MQGEISFGEEKWTTFSIQGKQGKEGKKGKKGREGINGKEREEKENLYEDNCIKLKVKVIFLKNEFWTPPPPINFAHGSHMYHIDMIGHVAAAPGPLACPSRGVRSPTLS